MQSVNMLTINEEVKKKEDLLEIIWKAFSFFPEGIWEGINYVGNVNVGHDLKIKSKGEIYGAFIFLRLVRRIREMKNSRRMDDLLLGVTHDPVIIVYHRFELERFRRFTDLVHDYVSDDVGILSLFKTDEEARSKIAAHGLGHSQGLRHHAKPVDLMYMSLVSGETIKLEGFCSECQRKLKNKAVVEKRKKE